MILRGMVHDKIQTQADPLLVTLLRQLFQILHRAQLLLNLTEIRHRIAAVRPALYRIQKRHQMDIIHPTALDILQLFPHPV